MLIPTNAAYRASLDFLSDKDHDSSREVSTPEVQAQSAENPIAAWASKPIPEGLKTVYLEKIAASQTLARSAQLRRLLEFLGQRTLGNLAPPTEYEVALNVLHRGAEFDPRSDSLVRKEMSRLRAKLQEYYSEEGSRDAVIVRSCGSYRLDFRWREGLAAVDSAGSGRCLLVLPVTATAADRDIGDLFYDELMVHLGSLNGCRLVSRTSARYYSSQPRDVREISSQCGADSVIEIALHRSGDQLSILLWLVDGFTGLARTTVRFDYTDPSPAVAGEAKEWVARYLSDGNFRSHE